MSARPLGVRPRRHLHRGTVRAAAFWFDPALLGEAEARRRVLAAWRQGASVHAVAGGYLLRLPRTWVVASDSAPGLPLTLEQGVLCSAPLSATERGQLEPREGAVVLVLAGVAGVHSLDGATTVDLSRWLDVSGWVVVPARGLGAPPPPVRVLAPLPPLTRGAFGSAVPTLAPEAQVMLARMQGKPPPDGLVVAPPPGLLARLRAAWSRRGAGQAGTGAAGPGLLARVRAAVSGGGGASAAGMGASSGPGLLARLRAAFRSGAAPGDAARVSGAGAPRGPGLLRRMLAGLGAGSGASAPAASGRPGLGARLAAWFLRGKAPRALPPGSGRSAQGPGSLARPSQPSALGRWLAAFFGRFATASVEAPTPAPGNAATPPPDASTAPPGPGLLSRMSEWMMRNTPLGQLLGQRKAEYMRKLFDMFEEGNLQEALRYAIPLNASTDEHAREALGLPGPREKLTIRPKGGGPASVFAGGEELFASLKERYRDAFRRLEREGRIDEAAFVLAELLGAHEEAVSFLERHGRYKLAAEVAEGRGLPPGLVVRQWLLAKDVARATAIARRSGTFSDAVLRLERTHAEEARVLRLLWGESLAESGDWVRAVQAVWPLTEARDLAFAWIRRGVECGGVAGARLLAMWASAHPDGLTDTEARVRELLDDDSPERVLERYTFAVTLSGEFASARRTALLTPTVRALLRDGAAGRGSFTPDFITRLLRDTTDGSLRTDLPPLSDTLRSRPLWSNDASLPLVRASVRTTDEGAFSVHDAVVLPDGRLLLALGEAGVRLLHPDGRVVAHLDAPAFALVPSIQGDRALALAPRGDVWRLSRLDLVARRATAWCDAPLDAWAPTYDGGVWFTASQRSVMMVDALAPDLRALWRVGDLPGRVRCLAADAARMSCLTEELERWTYDVPQGPTLRARTPMMSVEKGTAFRLLSSSLTADGEVAARVALLVPKPSPPGTPDDGPVPTLGELSLWLKPGSTRSAKEPAPLRQGREELVLTEAWRAEVLHHTGHWQVELVDARGARRALLTFEGEAPATRVRYSPGALLAFDSRGRVLWLDLESGMVRTVAVA
ncbi:bpX6 domain-containing protein [Pyxidicoccus xibeiensis]|uniref:bpX6 domain-containing protein n=1 Tax=Pyxidicoccus xibeiensis TaxID=2906759 RepID=UPI0020A6F498|nr:bpX6 domain-containing protein [Pyxidicoccus xibeiensis]MCP3139971.1 hypothetical protein [Pyxidicoccus xibeiensis]